MAVNVVVGHSNQLPHLCYSLCVRCCSRADFKQRSSAPRSDHFVSAGCAKNIVDCLPFFVFPLAVAGTSRHDSRAVAPPPALWIRCDSAVERSEYV